MLYFSYLRNRKLWKDDSNRDPAFTPMTEETMQYRRRQFLHLAAGAAALPAVSRIARAHTCPARRAKGVGRHSARHDAPKVSQPTRNVPKSAAGTAPYNGR